MQLSNVNSMLEMGAESIDITPTMFEEARTHYGALGNFLENNDIEADISPCGSIVMGTVTRPYSREADPYFDIDVIVKLVNLSKGSCSPCDVRDPIENLLATSPRYANRIDNCDECITLKYSCDGLKDGFRLDLDTCVSDISDPRIVLCPTFPRFSDTAVAIARKASPEWLGSNPQGLSDWFLEKNERFAQTERLARKKSIAERYPAVYASIEDVPDMMDRSSMQRAVQIIKRCRDEYYARCEKENPPASCILTVLCGMISEQLPDNATIIDFLMAFSSRMSDSGKLANLGADGLLGRRGQWVLENPVYGENMLSGWKNSDADLFFRWVEELERIVRDLAEPGSKQAASFEALFGARVGQKVFSAMGLTAVVSQPPNVIPCKPWRLLL